MICIWSFCIWCQFKAVLNILQFSKTDEILGSKRTLSSEVFQKSIYFLDSQEYSLRFELSRHALAYILTELWQFQDFTYFLPSWPSYLTYDLEKLETWSHDMDTYLSQV